MPILAIMGTLYILSLAPQDAKNSPHVSLPTSNYSLGTIIEGDQPTQTIPIKNIGGSPLTIHRIRSNSPFMRIRYPDHPIKPQDQITLSVTLPPTQGPPGLRTWLLEIDSDDPYTRTHSIRITGNVIRPLSIIPNNLHFSGLNKNEDMLKEGLIKIAVDPIYRKDLQIYALESDVDYIHLSIDSPSTIPRVWKIRYRLNQKEAFTWASERISGEKEINNSPKMIPWEILRKSYWKAKSHESFTEDVQNIFKHENNISVMFDHKGNTASIIGFDDKDKDKIPTPNEIIFSLDWKAIQPYGSQWKLEGYNDYKERKRTGTYTPPPYKSFGVVAELVWNILVDDEEQKESHTPIVITQKKPTTTNKIFTNIPYIKANIYIKTDDPRYPLITIPVSGHF